MATRRPRIQPTPDPPDDDEGARPVSDARPSLLTEGRHTVQFVRLVLRHRSHLLGALRIADAMRPEPCADLYDDERLVDAVRDVIRCAESDLPRDDAEKGAMLLTMARGLLVDAEVGALVGFVTPAQRVAILRVKATALATAARILDVDVPTAAPGAVDGDDAAARAKAAAAKVQLGYGWATKAPEGHA